MNDIFVAAAELQAICSDAGWRYCFIGGLALLRWGEPRMTADADLTLFTGFGQEKPFIEILLKAFAGRIPDAAEFALQNRVLLLRAQNGVGLDVSLGGLEFEERVVRRSTEFLYPPNTMLRTCSAEDLIVLKAFAGRGQDWLDVQRVIERHRDGLDWLYIREQLPPLLNLKDDAETMIRLEQLRESAQGTP